MYKSTNENQLIVKDMVDLLVDYVSIQQDIDESKVKAAQLIAQNIDLNRIIKKEGLSRCIDPQTPEDEELKNLIIEPLVFYTYARMLRMFQGVFTDGGYVTEGDERGVTKSVSNEMKAIAEQYMLEVIEFMKAEDSSSVKEENMTPSIRVFGGKEAR